jgi:hypothetical protein
MKKRDAPKFMSLFCKKGKSWGNTIISKKRRFRFSGE